MELKEPDMIFEIIMMSRYYSLTLYTMGYF